MVVRFSPTATRPLLRRALPGLLAAVCLSPLLYFASCTTANSDYCPEGTDKPGCVPPTDDPPDMSMEDPRADLSGLRPDLAGVDLSGRPDGGELALDIDKAGPYKTVSLDIPVFVGGNTTKSTVVGPTDDGTTLTYRGAPFPVVVLSPGFTLATSYFNNYAQRLASYGIITVMQKVANEVSHATYRDDTIALIDWLEKPTGPNGGSVRGRLDTTKLGLVGHSLGGTISLLVAASDPRVKAVFGLDPVDSNSVPARGEVGKIKLPPGVPLFYVGETISKGGGMPCAPADRNYEVLFAASSSPAVALLVAGAAHNDFIDLCGLACTICPGGTAPKDRTNRLGVRYVTAYFLRHLRGDLRAETYLSGGELGKDIAAGYVTRTSK